MDFLPDGRMVLTTTGDVSAGGWVPNPDVGRGLRPRQGHGHDDQGAGHLHQGRRRAEEPDGHPGHRRPLVRLRARGPHRAAAGRRRRRHPDGPQAARVVAQRRQLPRVRLRPHPRRRLLLRRPLGRHQQRRRDDQPAAGRRRRAPRSRSTAATWQVSTIAGGLRTPNGIGFGPEGGIFVNDNQGAWLPANKMVQIKQDRFFNHFTNPAGPFDTKPVTQPVLWMPHNEIANSPTNPVLLTDGPFKGQMLWGDLTYGGLQRGFLEKVDGEFQGAVFRHSAGLEVGVNRTVIGPDGAIYVGGIGEGGNWGEDNKLRYGLQKLTPNGKQRLRHGEDGSHRGRLQDHLHAARRRRGRRAPQGRVQVQAVALRPDVAVRRAEGRRGVPAGQGRRDLRGQEDGHDPRRRPQAGPRRARALAASLRLQHRRGAVEHGGLVHAELAAGLRGPGGDGLLRGRGGPARRRRGHRRPSTAATPAPASSAASATPART